MAVQKGDKIVLLQYVNPIFPQGEVLEVFASDIRYISAARNSIEFDNCVNTLTFENNEAGIWFDKVESQHQPVILDLNHGICSHELKTYTGLSKKLDYCTKCNMEFNVRGIWE